MSRDKQIEEMAKSICENYGACSKCSLQNIDKDDTCSIYQECEVLYNAGYRKASYVAEEIYNELDRYSYPSAFGGWAISMDSVSYVLKKYLGKDLNVPTKESEIT